MPFNYDASNPADIGSIPAFPANERAFRAAVEGFIDVEHDPEEGRHKFGFGNSTARDAITDWVDGSIWFLLEDSVYRLQLYYAALGGWLYVQPPSKYADRTAVATWTASQASSVTTITPGAGSPNTIAITSAAAPHRKVTLTANSILSNPTLFPANTSAEITLEVIQDGTGGRTLTFDTAYVFAGNAPPVIASAANAKSLLILKALDNGDWFVSAATDLRNS